MLAGLRVAVISNIRVYRLEISIPAVSFLLSSSRAKLMNASTEAFEQTIRKNTEIELIGLWSRVNFGTSAEWKRIEAAVAISRRSERTLSGRTDLSSRAD